LYCFIIGRLYSKCTNKDLSSVDDAINIALQNNQTIKASDLEIDASKALKKTAGELPNLILMHSWVNTTVPNSTSLFRCHKPFLFHHYLEQKSN
jgi:hypothetical protein